MQASVTYTRQDIERLKGWERPSVRCKFDAVYVDPDGRKTEGRRECTGRIIIDGNNPWVEISAAGKTYAERYSWGLVLAVLNDPHEPAIWFNCRPEYEIR